MLSKKLAVTLPTGDHNLDQNEEYFILNDETDIKIKFHEYEKIYQIPGLYEEIFHHHLKCQSPEVIADMLYKNVQKDEQNYEELRILDFGAGNGMVAEQLQTENPDIIVGIDILEEAKMAALRDREECYEDYFVVDLDAPEEAVKKKLESYHLNALVSVAALGFDHIPPNSFINAFNLIEKEGWIAFNIRDRFLTKEDDSGFKNTLDWMSQGFIELLDERTYRHRYAVNGEEIHYTALIGRKLADMGHQFPRT